MATVEGRAVVQNLTINGGYVPQSGPTRLEVSFHAPATKD
ncbi:hypothetical protein DEA8626_03200 [Defluviimonas aquaemixtae]|uniref:Uncharacterized protein n=1 Tax=Albidovulum aquaemixtae TaxID=1542388 RepID=A0A2R8BLE1_9RHOB|nr:hypothetical protein DEA8626_03200 [Defluviimonas aquaemixtae]